MNTRGLTVLSMIVLLACVGSTQEASACARCAKTPESSPWDPVLDCFAVPTGIDGTILCYRNSYGGCKGYGSNCNNGEAGPPSPWDGCFFFGGDLWCGPENQVWACLPESKPSPFRHQSTPLIGERVIRVAGLAVALGRYPL